MRRLRGEGGPGRASINSASLAPSEPVTLDMQTPSYLEGHDMDLGLSGRTVIVTGATGGIGRKLVRHFAAEGAQVVLT